MGAAVGRQRRGRTDAGAGGHTSPADTESFATRKTADHPPSPCPESPHGRGAEGSAGHRRSPQPPPSGFPGEEGRELPAFTHLTKPLVPGGCFPSGGVQPGPRRRQRVREEPPAPRDQARSRRSGRRTPWCPRWGSPRRGGGAPPPVLRGPDPAPPRGVRRRRRRAGKRHPLLPLKPARASTLTYMVAGVRSKMLPYSCQRSLPFLSCEIYMRQSYLNSSGNLNSLIHGQSRNA